MSNDSIPFDWEENRDEDYHQVLKTELQFRAFQINQVSKRVEKLIKEDEGKEKEQK